MKFRIVYLTTVNALTVAFFRGAAGFLFLVLVVGVTLTLESPSFAGENKSRFDGSVGGGFEQFSITTPPSGFKINNGTTFAVQGEKPFGESPFFLTSGLTYVRTSGNLNYYYVSPTATYSATNVNFLEDDFRLNLGLRLKLFNSEQIRPYIEGGGVAGYLQLSYDSSLRTPAVVAAGSDFKTLENILEFGYYAEAGLELQTGKSWGIRLSYNYLNCTTRNILTFNNQTISYIGSSYNGALFWNL